jgi:hypothetical protein
VLKITACILEGASKPGFAAEDDVPGLMKDLRNQPGFAAEDACARSHEGSQKSNMDAARGLGGADHCRVL